MGGFRDGRRASETAFRRRLRYRQLSRLGFCPGAICISDGPHPPPLGSQRWLQPVVLIGGSPAGDSHASFGCCCRGGAVHHDYLRFGTALAVCWSFAMEAAQKGQLTKHWRISRGVGHKSGGKTKGKGHCVLDAFTMMIVDQVGAYADSGC